MKEITRLECIKIGRTPSLELTRLDVEVALNEYVEKRGYKTDSLFHLQYEDGALAKVVVDIVK